MHRPLAWITGAGGLIGSHLLAAAPPAWQVVGLTRAQLELTDRAAVARRFRAQPPDLVLHCAALSRSPQCEADPPEAHRQNVDVTRHLAELATGGTMVFLSTDLVFDGRRGYYDETDPVQPLNVYGATKVAAEEALRAHPRHLIIRTSLNLGRSPTGDRGLDEQMFQAWRAGRTLHLFRDEFRCPLPAAATARAIWELVAHGATGIHHVAGAERLSRWDIGRLLVAHHPEFRDLIRPASLRDFTGPPRPADTSLNCAKAQARLSFALPRFGEVVAAGGPLATGDAGKAEGS